MIARVDLKFQQVDLSGTATEFVEIGRLVRSGTGGAELPDADPTPFDLTLHRISVVTVASDAVLIALDLEADTVEIGGPLAKLAILGDNLAGMADAEPPYHVHIEWHPDHFYLEEGSAPLIASLQP